LVLGLTGGGFAACGPDRKPGPPCDGPTYELTVRAENAPLPGDTSLNVRYGGNHEGESYALGKKHSPQAVFCSEDTTQGGATSDPEPSATAGAGGAAPGAPDGDESVWALRCRLYTQGPARIDVTASGYEPITEQDLTLEDGDRCRVEVEVELKLQLDAGM
jgi:hypothetical protein